MADLGPQSQMAGFKFILPPFTLHMTVGKSLSAMKWEVQILTLQSGCKD